MCRHDGGNPEIMELERNLSAKRYWDENWKEKLSGHGGHQTFNGSHGRLVRKLMLKQGSEKICAGVTLSR